jgi:hypothetical protein
VAGGTVLLSRLFPSAAVESEWTDGSALAAVLWAALANDDNLGADDSAAGGVEATDAGDAGWLFSLLVTFAWMDVVPAPVPLVLVAAPSREIKTAPLGSRSTLGFFWLLL